MPAILIKEPLNKGRQPELDIARGLSVLFMIAVHSLENFASETAQESWSGQLIDFLGGVPSAPVFMFLLGIGIVYSGKASPQLLAKRGMLLIGTGYVLNILRGVLPNLFNLQITGDIDYLQIAFKELLAIDILHFAGLAMITFGLIRKFRPNWLIIAAGGLFFALLNFKMLPYSIPDLGLQAFAGLFWGCGELSYFPYLTWIAYPLTGYLFGTLLIRCANKTRFYAVVLGISAFLLITFYLIFVNKMQLEIGLSSAYDYYHHNLFGNLINLTFVTGWLAFIYFSTALIPKALNSVIIRWSANVTDIFTLHWILIGWLLLLTDSNSLDLPYYLVLLVILTIISDSLAAHYSAWKKAKKKSS